MNRDCQTRAALIVIATSILTAPTARSDESTSNRSKTTLALPKSVDLRPEFNRWKLAPRSQGSRNTCSVFVTTGALEFAASKHSRRSMPLSVEYLNWSCNQVIKNTTADRGQFFHDLLKGFEQHGICMETDMPYHERFDPHLEPSSQAKKRAEVIKALPFEVHWINPWKREPGLTEEHLIQIKTVLAKGYPVAAGSSHSRLLIGYVDDPERPGRGLFLAKDSGAGTYNTVTYEFAKEKVGDLFWVEVTRKTATKD